MNVLVIPLVGIVMGCAIPIAVVYLDYKKKRSIYEMHHKERLAAIERGVEVPSLPPGLLGEDASAKRPSNHLLEGLVWSGVGAGMWIGGGKMDEEAMQGLGYIPLLIGVAYLLFYAIEGRKIRAALIKSATSGSPKV